MRKLASIRKITAIMPIEGADRIVKATINYGWNVVVKRDEFAVGDLCVYFEIDSLLPEIEVFEFLRPSSYVKESENGAGFRLRTIRLRKQLSQGLALPLSAFDELSGSVEGDDVTELLGVKKWEPIIPTNLAGDFAGPFPHFIPKTDQERVQNFIEEYNTDYRDHGWETSMKLDGASATYFVNDGHFGACSRNWELKESDSNSLWKLAYELELEERLMSLQRNIAVQGELMGPSVQGNREKLNKLDFFVYDMYDIDSRCYLGSIERQALVVDLGLNHVPVIATGLQIEQGKIMTVDEFLEMAELPSINHPIAEGLVFKSTTDPSVSFKAISNRFLLKEK